MTRYEWEQKLKQEYLSHDSVAKAAYTYWQEDGCPDGEQIDERTGWKIKEVHWVRAKMVLETLAEIDANTMWACEVASEGCIHGNARAVCAQCNGTATFDFTKITTQHSSNTGWVTLTKTPEVNEWKGL